MLHGLDIVSRYVLHAFDAHIFMHAYIAIATSCKALSKQPMHNCSKLASNPWIWFPLMDLEQLP